MPATRILFVEDDSLIRLVMADILREEGYQVLEAADGDDGASIVDGPHAFDLLFTDVQMPGKFDGIGVAVLARCKYPGIPVVVTSGYAGDLTGRLAVLDPPALFFAKPFDTAQLLVALRGLAAQLSAAPSSLAQASRRAAFIRRVIVTPTSDQS